MDTIALLLVGAALGALLASLWWRGRCLQLRAERDAASRAAVGEVTRAAASAAADQAARQLEQIERRAAHAAEEELDERRRALHGEVDALLRPLRDQMARYDDRVGSLQEASARLHGELRAQIEQLGRAQVQLQRETGNLVSALRRPEVRGSWGEQQLRRLVELAGMVEHCDFDEQVGLVDDAGERRRPDVVVHLPNRREVIIDAKVPLDAYLDALAADDEQERAGHLRRHAAQLSGHVAALARRGYHHRLEGAVDFVVAFVPRDPMLAAAFEHDPELFERAVASNVVIATPTTLIALLRAVAFGWQQEDLARNAREIAAAGRTLHERLATLVRHLGQLGGRLRSSVEAYNEVVGSFERRVLPAARRLGALGADGPGASNLEAPAPLTDVPRQLSGPAGDAGVAGSAEETPTADMACPTGGADEPDTRTGEARRPSPSDGAQQCVGGTQSPPRTW